jgi:hypothetical protein
MTEQEWLECTDPTPMLEYIGAFDLLSDRKQRLFDCACVRRIWHLLLDETGRKAVETAESFADGLASLDELREAQAVVLAARDAQANFHGYYDGNEWVPHDACAAAGTQATCHPPGTPDSYLVLAAAAGAAWEYRSGADPLRDAAAAIAWQGLTANGPPERRLAKERLADERKSQAALLREIVGNPFRSFKVSPSTVAWDLAEVIYDRRDYDHLPGLAEALEKAGCTDPKILGHCFLPGPHVRGCWVVDLVLGKH